MHSKVSSVKCQIQGLAIYLLMAWVGLVILTSCQMGCDVCESQPDLFELNQKFLALSWNFRHHHVLSLYN